MKKVMFLLVLAAVLSAACSFLTGPQGPAGIDGTKWHTGEGTPGITLTDLSVSADGDFYLDTATTSLYRKNFGAWTLVAQLRGSNGEDGLDGSLWLYGTEDPDDADGKDGDFYLNTAALVLYQKLDGSWTNPISLMGPAGNDGAAGTDGIDGTQWYTGNGTPDDPVIDLSASVDGDFYLDLITAALYSKTGGAWSEPLYLTGPQGPAGADGADGAPGIDGVDGTVWYTGVNPPETTVTDLSASVNGDFYLDTETSFVYVKSSGAWSYLTTIQGDTGPAGADGADGAPGIDGIDGIDGTFWFVGEEEPGAEPAAAKAGDLYLDTLTSMIYQNTSPETWVYQKTLVSGPSGAGIGIGTVTYPGEVVPEVINIYGYLDDGFEGAFLPLTPDGVYFLDDFASSLPWFDTDYYEGYTYSWFINGHLRQKLPTTEFDLSNYEFYLPELYGERPPVYLSVTLEVMHNLSGIIRSQSVIVVLPYMGA